VGTQIEYSLLRVRHRAAHRRRLLSWLRPAAGRSGHAHAAPRPRRRRPLGNYASFWLVLAVAVVVLCNIASDLQRPAQLAAEAASRDAAKTKRDAQLALVASSTTPAAFIRQCGAPVRRVHGMLARDTSEDYISPAASRIDTLVYQRGQDTYDVILSDSKDFPMLARN
jgi:hypothetical protein